MAPTRREWVSLAVIGVLWFGVYNVALNAGERQVDAGTAAMLIQLSPVLIAVLAAVFLDERFTLYLAVGLALAFGGVVLISLGNTGGDNHLSGVLLCLLSALVYSVSLILQKPLVARLSAVQVTWLACSIGTVACLPFSGDLVRQVADAPTSSVLWVVYLGVFPTAIAFTTYAVALSRMSASSLGVTTYLVPPITIALGLVFLGEAPPALAYVGGVLALVGVSIARRRRVDSAELKHSLSAVLKTAHDIEQIGNDDLVTLPVRMQNLSAGENARDISEPALQHFHVNSESHHIQAADLNLLPPMRRSVRIEIVGVETLQAHVVRPADEVFRQKLFHQQIAAQSIGRRTKHRNQLRITL